MATATARGRARASRPLSPAKATPTTGGLQGVAPYRWLDRLVSEMSAAELAAIRERVERLLQLDEELAPNG